ncbi:MAG: helix-turn-helix domain-containing protein [Mariniphaga sp.]|nr:helix-turn-helix domain-containing protein [Mariniphaga sp.]
MASNPFEVIEERLVIIENLIIDLKNQPPKVEQKEEMQQLLTVDELAHLLHLSKPTIYSNYSKGLLPGGCKQGKRLYFDKKIIISWIKSGRKLSNAEIEQQAEAYLSNSKRKGYHGK